MNYEEIFDRIRQINWCEHVGEPIPEKFYNSNEFMLFKRVRSWADAEEHYSDNHWVRVQTAPLIGITNRMQFYDKEQLQQYYSLTEQVNPFYEQEIHAKLTAIQQANQLNKDFLRTIRQDILCTITELVFSRNYPTPFHQKLITLYEAGHLPCGWDGPKTFVGTLIVF